MLHSFMPSPGKLSLERPSFPRKRAKAGIHISKKRRFYRYLPWVPAFAGTTLRSSP
jgi:hypothetical protein